MLQKFIIGCLLSSLQIISTHASADKHTLALGYAQSQIKDFKSIRGMNIQYRYEWNSPVSIIGSFTYMAASETYSLRENSSGYDGKEDVNYYSLLAGPAYRINDYVSLYAVVGLAQIKAESKTTYLSHYSEKYKENATSVAYGAGVVFNPVENISVNIGYEGTRVKYDESILINGFNMGVGYRF